MPSFFPINDLELRKAFETIRTIENFSNYIREIVELIYTNEFDKFNLDRVLQLQNIPQIGDIKDETLDLLLVYINLVLNDNIITENEAGNVKILKRIFKIKEGDFYKYRYHEVEEILTRQFERIYSDNRIDADEALLKVELQELFDLSYDQFLDLVNEEVKAALNRGASLGDLDTFLKPSELSKLNANIPLRNISQEVKDLVWNRGWRKMCSMLFTC